MSILDIFRTSEQPAASVPSPTPVAPVASVASVQIPQGQVQDPVLDAPGNEFADLWTVDPNADPTDVPFSFNLDQGQLAEAAKKLTITPSIPVALQQRIASGGQDAIAAMMEMQDITAQTVFAKNAAATTALIEQAVQTTQNRMLGVIDQRFKTLSVRNSAIELNSGLNDPAVRPLVHTIQQRILQKFPDATQAEIAEKTNSYFQKIGGILTPQQASVAQQAAKTRVAAETDWATELFS